MNIRGKFFAAWVVLATVLMLNGCPLWPEAQVPLASWTSRAAAAGNADAAMLMLNRALPAFGGLHVNDKGEIVVALTDITTEAAARPLISEYWKARDGKVREAVDLPPLRFVAARHTWFELMSWRDELRDVLALPDVVFLDADEACNCVTVAITQEGARKAVAQLVERAGVPTVAVRVIKHEGFTFAAGLRDQFRPTKGGVRIKFNSALSFGGSCTETLVASRFGVSGLLLNSHCTRTMGGVEGTEIYQSGIMPFGLDFVATETADPQWTAALTNCPPGRICRLSDSAFAELAVPSNGVRGQIALPQAMCGTTACSLDMANAGDALSIVGTSGAALVGDTLSKIGQTTGHTRGQVTATCVNMDVAQRSIFDPNNQTLMCQNLVGALLDHGDSGGPVFSLLPNNRAVLAGIAWGMTTTDTGEHLFAFSPWSAVESELGPLVVTAAGTSGGSGTGSGTATSSGSNNSACSVERDACMSEVAQRGGPRPQQCVLLFRKCRNGATP